MRFFTTIVSVAAVLTLALVLESERVLDIVGVAPNLLLVVSTVFAWHEDRFIHALSIFIVCGIVAFFLFQFWVTTIVLLLLSAIVVRLFLKQITGRPLVDYLFGCFISILAWRALLWIFFHTPFQVVPIFIETLSTIIFGCVAWFVVHRLYAPDRRKHHIL